MILLPLLLVLGLSNVAYSEEEEEEEPPRGSENMSDANIETKGGVEVHSQRFPINRYFANNEDRENMIRGAFVGFSNLSFTLAGFVVQVVDASMDIMYSLEPIDEFADTLTTVSSSVYDTLKDHFGELFFIIAIGYMIYLSIVRGSIKEVVRRSVIFFMVLVVGGYWMLNAGYLLKSMNALSVEAQGYLLEAGNGLITLAEGDGVYADTENIDEDDRLNGTVTIMRNVYFDMALKKPYLIANYGTTSENAVNNHDFDEEDVLGEGKYNRVDRMLSFELTQDGMDNRETYVDHEIEVLNNENIASGNVFQQLGISLIALIGSIGLGIPFFLLPFFNLILQLIALLLSFAIPFAFILSYIPHFANSGFVTIGKLLSIFVVKALLGILVLIVYLLCFIVDIFLTPNGFAMYLVNMVAMIGLFILMIKKRDAIVKVISAGKVQSVDNNMVKNIQRDMVNPALNPLQTKMAGLRLSSSKQQGQGSNSPSSPMNTPTATREQPTATGKKGVANEQRTAQTEGKQETPTSGVSAFMNQKNDRTPQQNKQTRAERKQEKKAEKERGKGKQQKQDQSLFPIQEKEKADRLATKQTLQAPNTERTKQSTNQEKEKKDLQAHEQNGRKSNHQGVPNVANHKELRSVQKGETNATKQPTKERQQERMNQTKNESTATQESLKPKERETKAPIQNDVKPSQERTKSNNESINQESLKPKERESTSSVKMGSNPKEVRTTTKHEPSKTEQGVTEQKKNLQPKQESSKQPSQTIKKENPTTQSARTTKQSNPAKQVEKRNQSTLAKENKSNKARTQQELESIEKEDDRHSHRG